MKLLFVVVVLLATALGFTEATTSPPPVKTLSWSELSKLPLPDPGERITYGDGPQQFGELRVPEGKGPFPVMVIIHGGCWMSTFDYGYITRLSAWLTQRGFATWTIEYRRVGDEGGGWPGTFLDVAQATDQLREMAKSHPLDLERVYAAGHSAGGQLALWLPTRARLPATSELYREKPLPIRGVLGLAAVSDLEQYRVGPADSCHGAVDQLLGGSPEKYATRYAETSPRQRLPLGVPQVFIQGEADPIVEPGPVRAYVDAAKKAGDRATFLPLPGAGHFEASVPLPKTEATFAEALRFLQAPNP